MIPIVSNVDLPTIEIVVDDSEYEEQPTLKPKMQGSIHKGLALNSVKKLMEGLDDKKVWCNLGNL